MSLQVWLPLTGHINNQGVDGVSVTSTAILDSAGKIGQCYSFSGVNYIAVPKVVLSSTTEWTYSAWIYLNNTSTTTATCLFSCRDRSTSAGYTIFLYPNNSKMLIDDGVRYEVTPMTFAAQTWYHITVVRKTTGKFIYVDGVLKASTTTVGTPINLNANGCLIGLAQSSTALTTGDQGWRGKLNDVRIYNHALSEKEIKELSKGLILHYHLSNNGTGSTTSSGTTEYDVSGHNYHSVKNGTLTYSNDSARYAISTQFNGTNAYIQADPLPASAITLSCWLKTTWAKPSGSNVYRIAVHDKVTGLAIGFTSNGSYMVVYVGTAAGGSGSAVTTTDLYQANKWNHIVVVKTGTNTRTVYINGQLATATTNSYWNGDMDKFFIGCRHNGGAYANYFDGQISDVRVYATALSANDVKELYNTAASLTQDGTLLAYEFIEG